MRCDALAACSHFEKRSMQWRSREVQRRRRRDDGTNACPSSAPRYSPEIDGRALRWWAPFWVSLLRLTAVVV